MRNAVPGQMPSERTAAEERIGKSATRTVVVDVDLARRVVTKADLTFLFGKWEKEGPDRIQAFPEAIPASTELEGAVVKLAAGFSVADSTPTDVAWDTLVGQDGTLWAAGSPTIFTIPTTGVYTISASVFFPDPGGTKGYYLRIVTGAGDVIARQSNDQPGVSELSAACARWRFTAADTVKCVVFHNAGAPSDVQIGSLFSIQRIRG